jgi:hypothetical protein
MKASVIHYGEPTREYLTACGQPAPLDRRTMELDRVTCGQCRRSRVMAYALITRKG